MKKTIFIFLLVAFIATGCMGTRSKNEIGITSEQIKDAFQRYNIVLSEPKELSPENVFITTLNGVKPEAFGVNDHELISFYVYSSKQEAEVGLKEFNNKTAAAELVAHNIYQKANILLFYVTNSEDHRVKELMEGLLVTK